MTFESSGRRRCSEHGRRKSSRRHCVFVQPPQVHRDATDAARRPAPRPRRHAEYLLETAPERATKRASFGDADGDSRRRRRGHLSRRVTSNRVVVMATEHVRRGHRHATDEVERCRQRRDQDEVDAAQKHVVSRARAILRAPSPLAYEDADCNV